MNRSDELQMQISPICNKNGEKLAYVTFFDDVRRAEGEIPKCIINSNSGFSDEEKIALEDYMKENLEMLKDLAKEINPIKSFMK